mgnify:CR=1 FL=1
MRTMFASLSIPNYRIYFSGTLLTNMGQWMARTAQSWLVLVILTHGNAAVLVHQWRPYRRCMSNPYLHQ